MLYIMVALRDDGIPVVPRQAADMSALPETPWGKERWTKGKCCRYATLLVCVFLHKGIISLLLILSSRGASSVSSLHEGGPSLCRQFMKE